MEPKVSVTSPQDRPVPRWSLGSSSGLHYGSFVNSLSSLTPQADTDEKPAISKRRSYVAVAVLCYINLINYMERYTIAGVLLNIQKFFEISDSTAALLQTVFICSFLLLAPLFGYLGDRYNRKYIMIGGLTVWLATAAGSSFVTVSHFWLLMLLRGLVGVGEASYSTIAPTIIGDLFTGGQRSAMICIFYIFIPIGSGLGYITGAGIATATGDWRWALRVRTFSHFMGLVLLIFLCPNPPRGAAETHGEGVTGQSPYLEDVKYLLKNKSYRGQVLQGLQPQCTKEPCNTTDSYIFGAVTLVTGIMGGCLGTLLSRRFRDKVPNADPIICAVGLLGSAPCLFVAIFVASASIPATYVFIFLGEVLISLNWAVMADILLYVVIPTRRSTAEALQISVCHLLGDAGSPYLVGVISDAISKTKPESFGWRFHSLKYSLLICPFVGILGGLFFLLTSFYIAEDRTAAMRLVEEDPPPPPPSDPTSEPSMELSTQEIKKE
ncbi:Protein spinster-like protein 3 Spinster-like protein 3 [Larimichthys crocea]|uniref:Protein spinster-like protein 3 Spinster-like protein 3 n=1 Tax=Larimichthys crocea TaxID=215358 RepID=A0A6G0I995_LARCR|nr:Protein spinster-like protein 3 Spinster-like protein 3 [Larimichthys crocea]